MKSNANTSSKGWAERMVDFLLGAEPHPVYMAGVAAGFGGPGRTESERSAKRPQCAPDDESALMGLASFGLSSYGASASRSEGGRR